MSNLSLKPVGNGKTVFFNSPLTQDSELVRTGITSRNSFYHALLLAYTDDYSSSSEDEKNEMVSKFIASLNKKITQDNWQELNFKHKIIELDLILIKTIEAFYEYLETKRNSSNNLINNIVRELRIDTNFSLFEAIFELISFSHFKNSLKSTINDLNNKSIREYKSIFINNIVSSLNFSKEFRVLDQEKKKYIINIITNFLTVFFREFDTECFKLFKNKVMLSQDKLNTFLMSVICSRFKRDLFIIDSTTKLPLKYPDFVKGKKSFVLLKFEDNFELVGRLKQKNNIQYEFEPEDEYIKKLTMFLLNPEKFKNKYSVLVKEKKKSVYVSDSESESEPEEKKQDLYIENNDDFEHQLENRKQRSREQRDTESERSSGREQRDTERSSGREQRDTERSSREQRDTERSSGKKQREQRDTESGREQRDKRESGFNFKSSSSFAFDKPQNPFINNFLYQSSDSDSDSD